MARQRLSLRGDEGQGNFDQLIFLRAEDDPSLLEWIRLINSLRLKFRMKFSKSWH